jgi:DAK2 domain fusion protein YloV
MPAFRRESTPWQHRRRRPWLLSERCGTNLVAVLDSLDATAIRRWCAAGLAALRRHQAEIDELNVYPVPDGDTGTNLVLTVTSAWEHLLREPDDGPATESEIARLGRVLHCMARGALLGARGSSGVIVSTLLRGIADALSTIEPSARGRAVARALSEAARAGYTAVAEPVEGTVLTVATAAAAAAQADGTDDLAAVVEAAAKGAAEALARTPEQLPVLAQAGVVDAGGRGLVVLLDALVEVVTGHAPAIAPLARVARDPSLLITTRESGSAEFGYEVQYLLDADQAAIEVLRPALVALGDALVIVGTGTGEGEGEGDGLPTWNVHVHVNDVGAAIEAGVEAGRPYRISVTRFADHIAARPFDSDARGVVVVAVGAGLARVFAGEGATVVDGGPTHNPSTAEILGAIRASRAGQVVLLPNNSNVHPVAAAAATEAEAAGQRVAVVPTRSSVQALAALAVRDDQRRFDDDVIAMAEAAGACRWAEVTYATRDALTVAGQCEAGDVLALVEGEVNLIGKDLTATCIMLLDRMLGGGGELVTLVVGAGAPADLAEVLGRHVTEAWPFVEVQCYHGEQAHYPLLVGVE